MRTISRVLGLSTMAAVAGTTLLVLSQLVLGDGGAAASTEKPAAVLPALLRAVATELRQTPTASIEVRTRAILVARGVFDKQKIQYNIKVPSHHVRPDTEDTEAGAVILAEPEVTNLLNDAQADPAMHMNYPEPELLPEDQPEFDCLSAPYRDPGLNLPKELSSAVINGLSLAYTPTVSADRKAVVLAPISIKRADYAAGSVEAKAKPRVGKAIPEAKVTVAEGRTLLIDGGLVKARPSESKPSRHLLVLLQPKVVASASK
jgi:hypothetical protein